MRICSFLPSATEIVYALGLGDSLRAVSHECDYPPGASRLPKVVHSVFQGTDHSSAEIDRIIADRMAEGKGIYEVDHEVLAGTEPDLLLTQELCGE